MSTSVKALLKSLKPGDMLIIPTALPVSGEPIVCFSAVLRVGEDGEFYISSPSEHRPQAIANEYNPLHWSDSKGALVDCDDDVPRWYSVDIQLERGGADAVAAEYAAVPRADLLKHKIEDSDMESFIKKDPRYRQISGVVHNGEAGSSLDQLSLTLDLMGVAHTKEQLVGLGCFLQQWHAQRSVRHGLMIAAVQVGGDDVSTGAGESIH